MFDLEKELYSVDVDVFGKRDLQCTSITKSRVLRWFFQAIKMKRPAISLLIIGEKSCHNHNLCRVVNYQVRFN